MIDKKKDSVKSILFSILFPLLLFIRSYHFPLEIASIISPVATISLVGMIGYKFIKGVIDTIKSKRKSLKLIKSNNIDEKVKELEKRNKAKRSILCSLSLVLCTILRNGSAFLPLGIASYVAPVATISLCAILAGKFLSSTTNIIRNTNHKYKVETLKKEKIEKKEKKEENQEKNEENIQIKKLLVLKEVINEYNNEYTNNIKSTDRTKTR